MNPWILLIAQYGIPMAYEIWDQWKDKTDPTEDDWQKLLDLAKKTAADYKAEAAAEITSTPRPGS